MSDIVERLKGPLSHLACNEAANTIEALHRERDTFYMDYRMKCDAETKALYGQLAASQAREQQLREAWAKVEEEYFSRLKEQDDITANFEAEKDMYGWNFHKGLRGGLVEFHIYMT